MSRPPEESRATTVGKWLLAIVVPASAQALGSLPVEALIAMSALSALSCALLWSDTGVWSSRATRPLLAALVILLAMTVLQAVPLPAAFVRVIAPENADIWERALSPLHEGAPAWHPLSVAPPATRVEVLRGFFYGTSFLAALRVASLEHGERFLVRVAIASTSLMAFSALAHTAVNAEKVFGIYTPHEMYAFRPGHRAPLLNTNHLAAYLGMGACVSLGALLSGRAMPRALSASTTLVLAATSVSVNSRGATGALLFGVLLTFALTLYVKRHFDSASAGHVVLAACATAAVIIVSITVSSGSSHLLSHDLTKVDVAANSLRLVRASPLFGSGRGGFESIFASVNPAESYLTWTNPEDIVIQWLVEWGVPVSIAGFALLGWALRPQVLLRAVRPAVGPWVALVAGLLHELVDYHFEVPGITVLAVVCAAVVVGARPKRVTTDGSSRSRAAASPWWRHLTPAALVIGTAVAIVASWSERGHTLAEERRRLSAESVDRTMSAEHFREDVRASMLRYPAEPFLPLMGAVRAHVMNEGSAVPWTARALERNARFGRAHFVLAQTLGSRHAAQARLEYRLAYESDTNLRAAVVREALPLITDSASALELVPQDAAGPDLLDSMVEALAPRLPATAVILDAELLRRAPAARSPFRRRAEATAKDALDDAPWCVGRPECIADALAAAEQLAARDPDKCGPHVLVARLLIKKGEVVRALDDLERAADVVSDRTSCQRQLITLALEVGQRARSNLALERLVRNGCGATAECIDLYTWAASVEESQGHFVRAVRLYRRVLDLGVERDDLLQHIGALGDKDGVLVDAISAYETLESRHPGDPQWPARIAELRARRRPPSALDKLAPP